MSKSTRHYFIAVLLFGISFFLGLLVRSVDEAQGLSSAKPSGTESLLPQSIIHNRKAPPTPAMLLADEANLIERGLGSVVYLPQTVLDRLVRPKGYSGWRDGTLTLSPDAINCLNISSDEAKRCATLIDEARQEIRRLDIEQTIVTDEEDTTLLYVKEFSRRGTLVRDRLFDELKQQIGARRASWLFALSNRQLAEDTANWGGNSRRFRIQTLDNGNIKVVVKDLKGTITYKFNSDNISAGAYRHLFKFQ